MAMADDASGSSGDDVVKRAKDAVDFATDLGSGASPSGPPPPSKLVGEPIPPPSWGRDDDEPTDEEEAQSLKIPVEEYRARRKAYDDQQNARRQREREQSDREEEKRRAEEKAEADAREAAARDNLLVGAGSANTPPPVADPDDPLADKHAREEADENTLISGCTPKLLAGALVILALAVAGVFAVKNRDSGSDKTTTAAGAESCSENSARTNHIVLIACDKPTGLDGHWVLVSGLTDPAKDMPIPCPGNCPNYKVTVDTPQASIDISGTKITGGTYKTGYTATLAGDQCPFEAQSKMDGTVSGGVDLNQNYGTVVIDGKATDFNGCDANYQPFSDVSPNQGHMSRFLYVQGGTMFLCRNLNATFNGCTDPDNKSEGPVGTFQRG